MTTSRKQQKAETRRKLLKAALAELGSGRSFDTLSLREVARTAGIAPTSFYRHFHDMEELGLALIEEGGETLRQLMKDVREQAGGDKSLIRASVETLFDYFQNNPELFCMIFQESLSGQPVFRRAATGLLSRMTRDLTDYLEQEADQRGVSVGHVSTAADAMVAILFSKSVAMQDKSANKIVQQQEIAITQLKMIMLGAEAMGQRQ